MADMITAYWWGGPMHLEPIRISKGAWYVDRMDDPTPPPLEWDAQGEPRMLARAPRIVTCPVRLHRNGRYYVIWEGGHV